MITAEQEGCTTEMVLRADIAALQFIFKVRKEALRQFQNQLVTLRKEQKPNTNCDAIRGLLHACRSERFDMESMLTAIDFTELLIEEARQHKLSEQSCGMGGDIK